MPKLQISFAITLFSFSLSTFAVTYGGDHREEVLKNPQMARLSRATAMMIGSTFYQTNPSGFMTLQFPLLSSPSDNNVCADEKFASQPANSVACTGFLVAPDLLVTAGHCMLNTGELINTTNEWCTTFNWLFDYKVEADGHVDLGPFPSDRLFSCKKILYAGFLSDFDPVSLHTTFHRDIALIQLDRPVPASRVPFRISPKGPQVNDVVSSIGYPLGLPAKYVGGGLVFDVSNTEYFRARLDAFGGQSGSPVFNDAGLVEGVLVRAFPSDDFVTDTKMNCDRTNTCDAQGRSCLLNDNSYPVGTELQRISPILQYL